MSRYVAFLRGMNLGGRRIANEELRSAFDGIGFADAATFRASGNVVFDVDGDEPREEIRRRIEEGLEATLGYAVPTFLRSSDETGAIAAHEPFDAAALAASRGKLQVVLLTEQPSAEARDAVLAHATDDDRLAFAASELYWLPSGGISESDLDLDAIGRVLGLTTIRTKGTIELIAAKHCQP